MRNRIAGWMLVAASAVAASADDQPPTAAKPADAKVERRLGHAVDRVAVSPDGKWVAASDNFGALVLFSAETDEKRVVVQGDAAPSRDGTGAVRFDRLVFTQDGSALVAVPAAADNGAQILHVFGVADGKELRTLDVSTQRDPETRHTSSGDTLLDVGNEPGASKLRLLRQSSVEIWDTATGERTDSRKNDPYAQRSVCDRAGALVACNVPAKFWLVEAASGKQRWAVEPEHVQMRGNKVEKMWMRSFHVLGFTSDSRLLLMFASIEETKDPASLNADNLDKRTKKTVRIESYATADGKPAWHHDLSEHAYNWETCVGSDIVAVIDDDKLVFLNATTGSVRESAPATVKYSCVAAGPDGLTFWAGTGDGQVVKAKAFLPAKKN